MLWCIDTIADEIYTVQRGDSLSKIAKKFDISVAELREANKLNSDDIKIGQKIIIKKNTGFTPILYTVRAGDTLSSIARRNNTSPAQIISWNSLKTSSIKVNQKLIVGHDKPDSKLNQTVSITPENTKFHIVYRGETLSAIARKYDLNLIDLIEYNQLTNLLIKPGQKLALQPETLSADDTIIRHKVLQGENLYRIALQYAVSIDDIRSWNNLSSSNLKTGQVLEIHNAIAPTHQSQPTLITRTPTAVLPVNNVKVTSEFGMRGKSMHKGIDFAGNAGDPVFSVLPGTVAFSGVQRGYGNVIIIEHENSVMTVYGHNGSNLVKIGDTVVQRQRIATIGNTGNTTAYHLHFEYRLKGIAQNPRDLLPLR